MHSDNESQEAIRWWSQRVRNVLLERGGSPVATLSDDTSSGSQPNDTSDLARKASKAMDDYRSKLLRTALRRSAASEEFQPLPDVQVSGMRKWEGRVVEVDDNFFTVDLVPFDGGVEVVADFERSDLADDDDPQIGDVVYVTVRRTGRHGGRKTTTAAVRLRRLGRWTAAEIADQQRWASEQAAELSKYVE